MLFRLVPLVLIVACSTAEQPAEKKNPNDERAMRFVEQYEAVVKPLAIEVNLTGWDAEVSGKEENYAKKQAAEEKLDLTLSDPEKFAELKAIREAGVSDPLLARQMDIIYRQYLSRQIPPELLGKISAKENEIQRKFNIFRSKLDGKEVTDNQLRQILTESHDSDQLKAAWEASKQVGPVVLEDLKELIALRNEAAKKLGFPDFHAMRLFLAEQDREEVTKLFDELDELTREPFLEAKAKMDAALAKRCGIEVEQLRPWHYQNPFFQEAPAVPGALPESVYKSIDTVETCRKFYDGIGLPVDDILKRSDLFEKPGKNPHAFCTDIDREGDVRIFQNVVPGKEWLTTTMHELGHAVYSKQIGKWEGHDEHEHEGCTCGSHHEHSHESHELPYVLRNDAHILVTEGVAMMFDRFPLNVDWLVAMGAEIPEPDKYREAMTEQLRLRMLIFARWAQVMYRFEKALYENPDQDLNKLWWDLVEKYQGLKRPEGRDEPDFAAKYHIVGSPAYYHNYMMGEMFSSQLHHALIKSLKSGRLVEASVPPDTPISSRIYVGDKRAGEFLTQRVFAPGASIEWNEFIRRATGEKLSPKAFAEDIKPKTAK